jgi:hypothetical protein
VWSVRAGGMDRPISTISHPAGPLLSSQPGGPPCWVSPLAFGIIGWKQMIMKATKIMTAFVTVYRHTLFPVSPPSSHSGSVYFLELDCGRCVNNSDSLFILTSIPAWASLTPLCLYIAESEGVSGDLGHAFLTINHKVMG